MKHVLLAIAVALFPYLPVILLKGRADIEWTLLGIGLIFVLALVSSVVYFVLAMKKGRNGKELSFIGMIIKLIHIPAYIFFFIIGAGGIMFIHFLAITILIFVFDCMTIALSGVLELAAVLRARAEGVLKKGEALICAVCSFLFCVDVIVAVYVFLCARKRTNKMIEQKEL